jgi:hypothetical protein
MIIMQVMMMMVITESHHATKSRRLFSLGKRAIVGQAWRHNVENTRQKERELWSGRKESNQSCPLEAVTSKK